MIFEIPVYSRISRPGTNHAYVYASKHVCMNVYMCVCMHVYVCMVYACTHDAHVCIYLCMYV